MEIAVYGKGGIGKSTICANLSAALAQENTRILQIGCDPKHDSTRLLHHGTLNQTVLDYLMSTSTENQRLGDVLIKGYRNIGCVEAGGPKPGMGCAGRGILTCFEFLDRCHVKENYDHIIYDVLGDVVCGGFAVPVRKQYADTVFLVTSGEYMSIYAANNILQGIRNLDAKENRIGGIIYNSRNMVHEKERVYQFAKMTGVPVCAEIPRSDLFSFAEQRAATVTELYPDSEEAGVFQRLAVYILRGLVRYEARPLSETAMEQFMCGKVEKPLSNEKTFSKEERGHTADRRNFIEIKTQQPDKAVDFESRPVTAPYHRIPLYGCAFNGAMALSIHMGGAALLAHAPKSCIWYTVNCFNQHGWRGLFNRGILYPVFSPVGLEGTDINANDVIFGGVEHARQKMEKIALRSPRAIIVVTSCVPGLAGDDLSILKQEFEQRGIPVHLIYTDGVAPGDYNAGMALCYREIAAQVIRRDVECIPNTINIVYENVRASNRERNYKLFKEFLHALNLKLNCRFICETHYDEVAGFLKAPWNVMARMDDDGIALKKYLEEEYGCRFIDGTLPVGYGETCKWLRTIGKLYGRTREAEAYISDKTRIYKSRIKQLRKELRGKRLLLFVTENNCGWILELAEHLEMNIAKLAVLGRDTDNNPVWNHRHSAEFNYDRKCLAEDIRILQPDLILTNESAAIQDTDVVLDTILPNMDIGFFSGIQIAEGWKRKLENHLSGGWKHDAELLEKYYS